MKLVSLIAICSFLIISCSKVDENVNKGHSNGIYDDTAKNFFKCYINGNLWRASCDADSPACFRALWLNKRKDMYITVYNYSYTTETESMSMVLHYGDTLVSQAYTLYDLYGTASYKCFDSKSKIVASYTTDAVHKGVVQIFLDSPATRVNGYFNFPAWSKSDSTTVNIMSGSFSMPVADK